MANEERYYSRPGPIAPLALPNQLIGLWARTEWHCYRVTHLEPIPRSRPFVFELTAGLGLAAGAYTGHVSLANLAQRQHPPECFQLRFYPLDDVEIIFYIGTADTRFMTNNLTATADLFTKLADPDLHSTEVVVLTSSSPYLDAFNPTGYTLAQVRVAFFGYRYSLDEDSAKQFKTAEQAMKELGPITLCSSGGF